MLSDAIKILKEKNIKATRQRIQVLDQLMKSDVCLNVEEIYKNLKSKNIAINLATVYRITDELFKKGVVEKNLINKKYYFEFKKMDNHHHYFVCIKCNKKSNIVDCKINIIEKELSQKNFKVISHNLEIYGICNKCGRMYDEKD